jgi:predicted RNase H-like HicB family nuclease
MSETRNLKYYALCQYDKDEPGPHKYSIMFPGIVELVSEGRDVEHCKEMAKEIISLHLDYLNDRGLTFPVQNLTETQMREWVGEGNKEYALICVEAELGTSVVIKPAVPKKNEVFPGVWVRIYENVDSWSDNRFEASFPQYPELEVPDSESGESACENAEEVLVEFIMELKDKKESVPRNFCIKPSTEEEFPELVEYLKLEVQELEKMLPPEELLTAYQSYERDTEAEKAETASRYKHSLDRLEGELESLKEKIQNIKIGGN